MAGCAAEQIRHVSAGKLATVQHRVQDIACLWRQLVQSNFFLCPKLNPSAQQIWLNKLAHDLDLIDRDFEEEPSERCEGFLAEIAPTIKIVAARKVAFRQMSLIFINLAREAPCHRP